MGGARVYDVMTAFNQKRLVGHANDTALSALADNLLVVNKAPTKINLELLYDKCQPSKQVQIRQCKKH